MKCDRCGKEFKPGNRPNGVPNGVQMKFQNGKTYTLCADCMIEGADNPEVFKEVERCVYN